MSNRFVRSEMLLGGECMERLKNASVAIFGVGGVGSYVAEALAERRRNNSRCLTAMLCANRT